MGRPYAAELEKLPETYAWSLQASVTAFADHIQGSAKLPLLTIGSGGSFTAASFSTYLHQVCTGQIAKALTPLEVVYTPLDLRDMHLLLLTAGGNNPDILGAFTRLVEREPHLLSVVCTRSQSPLARLAASFKNACAFEFDIPTGKDGYLATNSLLATLLLLIRAYETAGLLKSALPRTFPALLSEDATLDVFQEQLAVHAVPLWGRRTLVVLHTPATQAAAIDLESRFSEAALGNVQITDYRNFAHGRHYWLARQQHTTALVAFVTSETEHLADQTLRLVPDEIPVLRIDLPEEGVQTALTALIYSLYLAQFAGHAAHIDPGRPVVPAFGRRLYRLQAFQTLPKRRTAISAAETVAIERKSRKTIHALESCGEIGRWRAAYHSFVSTLLDARFAALVFDYDGTLCDAWERFEGPRREVIEHLERLSRSGCLSGWPPAAGSL
jgi:fructoselysine-6-P-deglycase FrlB-like protein